MRTILFAVGLGLGSAFCVAAPEPQAELTLSQFRNRVQARASQEGGEVSLPRADRAFQRLLRAQGREAAARQSLDRLTGWAAAVQARFEAQNAPALDVEILRFAESKAAAELARYEAGRWRAMEEANRLLGRPPEAPLVALLPARSPATEQSRASSVADGGKRPAFLETVETELLPQAQDLLAKMYRNYLFGGISLSTLLWQEQEVFRTELQYRIELANAAMESLPTPPLQ